MSWSNSNTSTNSSRFKLKRAHSPDPVGVNNYKKQMLIQDFERLSLRDNSHEVQNQVVAANNNALNEVGIGLISIPRDVKKHVRKLRSTDAYNDEKLVYEKLREVIRNKHLQVVSWYNPLEIVYHQWLKWIQTKWIVWPTQSLRNDMNHDIYEYDNFYAGYDSDVDMDT